MVSDEMIRAGRLLDGIEHNDFPHPSHDGRV